MNNTSIEWTHRPGSVGMTWNPIHFKRDDGGSTKTGNMCTRISPGCTHCYASTLNARWGNRLEYTVENLSKGHFYLDEKELQAPLRAKKPCTIFVGDMFDLFHEAIPRDFIAEVWGVMALAHWHTFQALTKRAQRMHEILPGGKSHLSNVWLGVSVESQKYADERIPLLLQTPAAVRFLSVEPQLEAVDLFPFLSNGCIGSKTVDWVICGGESGPGARPFDLAWAESLREQCKSAGVAFFMKQVGAFPVMDYLEWDAKYSESHFLHLRDMSRFVINPPPNHVYSTPNCVGLKFADRKGGDPSEWPESLRVREWPR